MLAVVPIGRIEPALVALVDDGFAIFVCESGECRKTSIRYIAGKDIVYSLLTALPE